MTNLIWLYLAQQQLLHPSPKGVPGEQTTLSWGEEGGGGGFTPAGWTCPFLSRAAAPRADMYVSIYRIMHKHTSKCSDRSCCCSGKLAWKEEFWPTTAAEYVLHLLWTLSKRALWLSEPELRQAYVSDVPKVSLDMSDADPWVQCKLSVSKMCFLQSTSRCTC